MPSTALALGFKPINKEIDKEMQGVARPSRLITKQKSGRICANLNNFVNVCCPGHTTKTLAFGTKFNKNRNVPLKLVQRRINCLNKFITSFHLKSRFY